jgi:hypothetical protein
MFSRTIRYAVAAVALVSLPALAFAESNSGKDAPAEHAKKGKKAEFPMPADEFRAHVEKRITRGREKLVEHMKQKGVKEDRQQEILAKFDEGSKQVRDATDKVCADGTVTKDEAQSVRDLAKSLREAARKELKGHGKEARKDHKKNNKKDA